jgi:DNA-binding NarL/FixJ family response regulator
LKILIIDGFIPIIDRLKELIISETSNQNTIHHAINYNEAITKINKEMPGVVILDINLPDNESFKLLKYIKHHNAGTVVIILSIHIDNQIMEQAVVAGADYFLDKYSAFEKLPSIIQAINVSQQKSKS